MSKKKRRFFAGSPQKVGSMTQDVTNDVDLKFVQLVKERHYQEALNMLEQVENINTLDPHLQATALHLAAARSAENFIDQLCRRPDIDYLVKDKDNRLASEIAWHVAENEELGAKLMHKEKNFAEISGQPAWPKTEPD